MLPKQKLPHSQGFEGQLQLLKDFNLHPQVQLKQDGMEKYSNLQAVFGSRVQKDHALKRAFSQGLS